jgi:hypothetical protein
MLSVIGAVPLRPSLDGMAYANRIFRLLPQGTSFHANRITSVDCHHWRSCGSALGSVQQREIENAANPLPEQREAIGPRQF